MNTNELRDSAINETKIGGNPQRAIALAILYVGDRLEGITADGLEDAIRSLVVEVSAWKNES